MTTPTQLVAAAKEIADMSEADPDGFVTDATWLGWCDDGTRELHDVVANCFKATFFRTTDFVLTGGPGSGYTYTLPANLKRVKGVDIDADTPRRLTVRPANFGDRNNLRTVGTSLALITYCRYRRYTVLGSGLLQIQPMEQAAGNYRLYWVPQPTTFGPVKRSVRVLADSLPTFDNGSLPVLIASSNGELPAIDGVSLQVGDLLLFTGATANVSPVDAGQSNGIYQVISLGSVSSKWTLRRPGNYESNAEVLPLDLIAVQEGDLHAHSFWQQTATTVDVDTLPLFFSEPTLEPEIDIYHRYIELFMARQGLLKEKSLEQAQACTDQMNQIRADMMEGLENDEGGAATIVDVYGGGFGNGWY